MKKETLIWAAKLFGGIFILAVILWAVGVPMWFGTIFILIGAGIGLPHVWEKFGKGSYVWSFWGGILKRGNKIAGLVAIYLLLRGSIAYLVRFPLASSGGMIHDNPLVTAIGFIHPSLLFEASFLFIVGGTIYMWFFQEKKWAKITTVVTILLIFIGVTWCLSVGSKVVSAAIPPLTPEKMAASVEKNGVIGGTVRQVWEFGFGMSTPKQKPTSTPASLPMITSTIELKKGDRLSYTLQESDGTPWILSPTGVNCNIHPTNKSHFRVYYWDGTVVDVKDKDVGLPDKCPAKFKVIKQGEGVDTFIISGI